MGLRGDERGARLRPEGEGSARGDTCPREQKCAVGGVPCLFSSPPRLEGHSRWLAERRLVLGNGCIVSHVRSAMYTV